MSHTKCSRIWIVEAVRDGRVKGKEREAFERHLPNCPDCLEESRLLDELAQGLRGLAVSQPDALSVRRQRQRLMAESDASRMRHVRSSWPRRFTYAMAMAAGVGLIFGLWRWSRHDVRTTDAAMAEAIIDVRPDHGARWRHTRSGETSGVELEEGAISLRIQRRGSEGRVVITVPDGEIEDFGTVLRVRVVEAHTTEVIVQEGNVAIRIRGLPELRLGPGQSWAPPLIDIPPPEIAPLRSVDGRTPPPGALGAPSATSRHDPTAAVPGARHSAHADGPADIEDAKSRELHDAEDQAYLQVVTLARAGKAPEARVLARDYLLRFPNGFRRVEMLDIATGPSESR